ncbi:hypothetical protein CALK_2062 [Chitinivibrio alkaliphilus ACht1]|uniref:Uncharacterized protein n=2 Tax=Chitinivibrio TaxID=1505231 RepID=U7D3L9_9BACT|nr:hypothetical protein CALK_2062 [Chitinivibrio alkaliphilus ACht1]
MLEGYNEYTHGVNQKQVHKKIQTYAHRRRDISLQMEVPAYKNRKISCLRDKGVREHLKKMLFKRKIKFLGSLLKPKR